MTTYNLDLNQFLLVEESERPAVDLSLPIGAEININHSLVVLPNPIRLDHEFSIGGGGMSEQRRATSLIALTQLSSADGGGGHGGDIDLPGACPQWDEYLGSLDLIPKYNGSSTGAVRIAYTGTTDLALKSLSVQPVAGQYVSFASGFSRIISATALSSGESDLVIEAVLPSVIVNTSVTVYDCLSIDTVSFSNSVGTSVEIASNQRLDSFINQYGGNRLLFEKISGVCRVYGSVKKKSAMDYIRIHAGNTFYLRGAAAGPFGAYPEFALTSPVVEFTNVPNTNGSSCVITEFSLEFLRKSPLT